MLTQSQRDAIVAQMMQLKVPWKTRQRPRNYQELALVAKAELRGKFEELMERAEFALKLFRDFDSIDWDKPPEPYQFMVDYGDDDGLDRLNELVENWKDVRSEPGEGYW